MNIFFILLSKDLKILLGRSNAILSSIYLSLIFVFVSSYLFRIPTLGNLEIIGILPAIILLPLFLVTVSIAEASTKIELDHFAVSYFKIIGLNPGSIYFEKILLNSVLILLSSLIITVISALFYSIDLTSIFFWLFLIFVLGSISFSAIATISSFLSCLLKSGSQVLSMILFPLSIPVIWALNQCMSSLFSSGELNTQSFFFALLVGLPILYILVGYLVFSFLYDEIENV